MLFCCPDDLDRCRQSICLLFCIITWNCYLSLSNVLSHPSSTHLLTWMNLHLLCNGCWCIHFVNDRTFIDWSVCILRCKVITHCWYQIHHLHCPLRKRICWIPLSCNISYTAKKMIKVFFFVLIINIKVNFDFQNQLDTGNLPVHWLPTDQLLVPWPPPPPPPLLPVRRKNRWTTINLDARNANQGHTRFKIMPILDRHTDQMLPPDRFRNICCNRWSVVVRRETIFDTSNWNVTAFRIARPCWIRIDIDWRHRHVRTFIETVWWPCITNMK